MGKGSKLDFYDVGGKKEGKAVLGSKSNQVLLPTNFCLLVTGKTYFLSYKLKWWLSPRIS